MARPPPGQALASPNAMSEEDIYNFDTSGWLRLPSVLSPAEVRSAAAALAAGGAGEGLLADHPALQPVLEQLVVEHRVDRSLFPPDRAPVKLNSPPQLLAPSGGPALRGGAFDAEGHEIRSRSYYTAGGRQYCRGLRVVWVLSDAEPEDGTLAVIGASHRSSLPAPTRVLSGDDTMGTLERLELATGDLLVLSSALLFGVRPAAPQNMQGLLISEVITPHARSSPGSPIVRAAAELEEMTPEPEWMGELSPQERAVLGLRDPAALRSDGHSVWLDDNEKSAPSEETEEGDGYSELWLWDL